MKKFRSNFGMMLSLPSIVLLVLAAGMTISCQANSISGGSASHSSDLKLSFKVLGLPYQAQGSSSVSKSISKLILPTASTLSVSLTPIDPGLSTPGPQAAAISGSNAVSVSVSFPDVDWGHYTVKAVAANVNGVAQFQQSSDITVSSATDVATINLVPANPDHILVGSNYPYAHTNAPYDNIGSVSIAAWSTYVVEIPAEALSSSSGNGVPNGQYQIKCNGSSTDSFIAYVQNPDGALKLNCSYSMMMFVGYASNSLFVAPSSTSGPSYITLYNNSGNPIVLSIIMNSNNG